MKRNLDLSPEQVTKIEAISLAREQRADSMLKEVRPKLHALLEETRKEIDQVLTPEQRARAQALWRQHEEARRKAGPGGPGPGMDSSDGKR
jgi:Spy/CpxP family protein refolding chaperone